MCRHEGTFCSMCEQEKKRLEGDLKEARDDAAYYLERLRIADHQFSELVRARNKYMEYTTISRAANRGLKKRLDAAEGETAAKIAAWLRALCHGPEDMGNWYANAVERGEWRK